MRWSTLLAAPLVVLATPAWSTTYLSLEQAQQLIFPGESLHKVPFSLTRSQRDALRERTGVHEPFNEDGVWAVGTGGFFVIDRVVGKHELITYAVGISLDGTVKQIEVLEYRETYGSEVRNPAWRKQFVGKSAVSQVKLNQDIVNIAGATLSSKHLTDGVRRVLAVYDMALKTLSSAQH